MVFRTKTTSGLEEIRQSCLGPASNLAVVHEIILGGVVARGISNS